MPCLPVRALRRSDLVALGVALGLIVVNGGLELDQAASTPETARRPVRGWKGPARSELCGCPASVGQRDKRRRYGSCGVTRCAGRDFCQTLVLSSVGWTLS